MSEEKDDQRKSELLRELFEHHAGHFTGDPPYKGLVDIYVDGEVALQFQYGSLNLGHELNNTSEVSKYLDNKEELSRRDEGGFDIWEMGEDWTPEEATKLCVEVIEKSGNTIEDVTHAEEGDCPTNGRTDLESLIDSKNYGEESEENINTKEKLQPIYGHIYDLVIEAEDGIPDPIPHIEFHTEDEKIAYRFSIGGHTFESRSDHDAGVVNKYVERRDDLEYMETHDNSTTIIHYAWEPDDALIVSEKLLESAYGISLNEIIYAEFVEDNSARVISWEEFPLE